MDIAESYISDTLTKFQSAMGYADAKVETNRTLFKAYLANQTGGYNYGLLKVIPKVLKAFIHSCLIYSWPIVVGCTPSVSQ